MKPTTKANLLRARVMISTMRNCSVRLRVLLNKVRGEISSDRSVDYDAEDLVQAAKYLEQDLKDMSKHVRELQIRLKEQK